MFKHRLINLLLLGRECIGTKLLRTSSIQCFNTRQISHKDEMKSGSTVQQIRDDLRELMGVEKGYKPIPKSRDHLIKYLPTSASALPTRSMADSYMTAIIPLSTDMVLQESYITYLGRIRIGRILEDMDLFAVVVAMRYISTPDLPEGVSSPYTLVTAAVDRIDYTSTQTAQNKDLRLSGHVTYVGRSSIEVVVWVDQQQDNEWRKINSAMFLLAARDPTAQKAAVVNKLKPASPEEEAIVNGGLKRKELRAEEQKQHVQKVIPTQEEQQILHSIYLKSVPADININKRFVPRGCFPMDQATLTNLVFSQPQDRNFHNRVFGGFLMRQAVELAWITVHMFTKHMPHLKCISNIVFNKPIPVSSMIRMHAYVAYTIINYVQITLYAETLDPISGENVTTNALHFTFENPTIVPEIIPITYHENMVYIDGRRRFLETTQSDENLLNFKPITAPKSA